MFIVCFRNLFAGIKPAVRLTDTETNMCNLPREVRYTDMSGDLLTGSQGLKYKKKLN